MLFVGMGALFLAEPTFLGRFFSSPLDTRLPRLVGLTFIGFALGFLLFNYLQGQGDENRRLDRYTDVEQEQDFRAIRDSERITELLEEQRHVVQDELRSMREALDKGTTSQVIELSSAEKLKLLDEISKAIETTLGASFVKAVD